MSSDARAAMRHPERHVKPETSICLAWCSPGEVSSRFMESCLNTYWADANRPAGKQRFFQKGAGYLHIMSGPRIASARNHLVRNFLTKHTAEWLLMVDTDMVWEPDAIDKLLEAADPETRPIVGGLCFGGGKGQLFPTMYRFCDPAENNGNAMDWVREWDQGEIVQVDATGAAFLLIHRSLLQKMGERYSEPVPWFAESIYKGAEFGEDMTFCLRAMQMEVPIFVHTGVSIGHEKSVILDEEIWRNMNLHLKSQGLPDEEAPTSMDDPFTVVEKKLIVVEG